MSYKSSYTGAQIDSTVSAVINKTYPGSASQSFTASQFNGMYLVSGELSPFGVETKTITVTHTGAGAGTTEFSIGVVATGSDYALLSLINSGLFQYAAYSKIVETGRSAAGLIAMSAVTTSNYSFSFTLTKTVIDAGSPSFICRSTHPVTVTIS